MNYFYSNDKNGDTIVLSEDEFRHCIKSLRKKIGETIHVLDGAGGLHKTRIDQIKKNHCNLVIEETSYQKDRPFSLTIGIAPTKNISRFEWFLEKATEIGVSRIIPFTSFHSERKRIREDRLKKIMVSAMKQSGRFFLPQLDPLQTLSDFIKLQNIANKYVAHYDESASLLSKTLKVKDDCIILIGPEGDFSEQEITNLNQAGYRTVILGHSRLRTETAGIVACNVFNLINE